MNEEPTMATSNNRKDRSLARSSIVAGAITGTLLLSGCNPVINPGGTTPMSSDSARPFDGTRAADVIRTDFYDTIEETVQQSGTTFPTWKRTNPKNVRRDTCTIGTSNGKEFSITLRGGSIDDPRAATQTIKAYWESKGWKIETIFDDSGAPNPGMQIAGTSPTGIEVVVNFTKNVTGPADKTDWSMIRVKSDCSLDPSLNTYPTPQDSSSPGNS